MHSTHYDHSRGERSELRTIKIPEQQLGALIDVIALGKSVVSDGDTAASDGFRKSIEAVEQLVYGQSHQLGGADAVWQDPVDGVYHHPTYPEGEGEAWKAAHRFRETYFVMRLVEILTEIIAKREAAKGEDVERAVENSEHQILDLIETVGVKGMLKALIA